MVAVPNVLDLGPSFNELASFQLHAEARGSWFCLRCIYPFMNQWACGWVGSVGGRETEAWYEISVWVLACEI